MALPVLDAMVPSIARAATPTPSRLMIFHYPIGMDRDAWRASGTETNWTLGATQAPLLPFKGDINVLTGVDDTAPSNAGGHATGNAHLMTCAPLDANSTHSYDVSYDQLVADKIGGGTKFRSLQLGTSVSYGPDRPCDPALSQNLSWKNSTGLPAEISPQTAFDRIFAGIASSGDAAAQAAIAKRKRQGKSVIDAVNAQRARLDALVGAGDKKKLDEYYTGVRELEKSIGSTAGDALCVPGTRPGTPADVRDHIKQMLDIAVLAFKCDLTRVITVSYEDSNTERHHPWLGPAADVGYHSDITHQTANGSGPGTEGYRLVNKWMVTQFAYLLDQMKKTSDGATKTLLDSSLVYFTTEITNGSYHARDDMPLILAGGGNGRMATGRLLERKGEAMGNIAMSILQAFDTGVTTFGAGYTRGMTGLMAT